MTVAENINAVTEKITQACLRADRQPGEVKLVVVTKTVDARKTDEAISAGATIIGESRVQEAWQKYQAVQEQTEWHLVGHLQTNKVKRALQFVSVIQSVDSLKLANEIDKQAGKLNRRADIFIQVNTSGEEAKFGFAPAEVLSAVQQMVMLANVRVKGLMTIGAFSNDIQRVRNCFIGLRKLRDKINAAQISDLDLHELSMGMTNDFELAIAEGATLVRIGRSIFGER